MNENLAKELKLAIKNQRYFIDECLFEDEQKEILGQYYDANKLLVECLNGACHINSDVRQEIEETLLLPIAEIEKRKDNISTHGE